MKFNCLMKLHRTNAWEYHEDSLVSTGTDGTWWSWWLKISLLSWLSKENIEAFACAVAYVGVTYEEYSGHSGTSWFGDDFQEEVSTSSVSDIFIDAIFGWINGAALRGTGVARATPMAPPDSLPRPWLLFRQFGDFLVWLEEAGEGGVVDFFIDLEDRLLLFCGECSKFNEEEEEEWEDKEELCWSLEWWVLWLGS